MKKVNFLILACSVFSLSVIANTDWGNADALDLAVLVSVVVMWAVWGIAKLKGKTYE